MPYPAFTVGIKTPGPVRNLTTGKSASVWPSDEVRVLQRVGSRRLCLISYGEPGYRHTLLALVPKRWLGTFKTARRLPRVAKCDYCDRLFRPQYPDQRGCEHCDIPF